MTSGNRLLNPYVGFTGVATKTAAGTLEIFRCPSDSGTHQPGSVFLWQPTVWDCLGYSYFYNCSANHNSNADGLWAKTPEMIDHPTRIILSNDFAFNAYAFNATPWHTAYWHRRFVNGWGNLLFCDGHVDGMQATRSAPDYLRGDGWSFVYND